MADKDDAPNDLATPNEEGQAFDFVSLGMFIIGRSRSRLTHKDISTC